MPHRLWKYPCCGKAEPVDTCVTHGREGFFVGWWPTPAEQLARYVTEYGLTPKGAHRQLMDRLLDRPVGGHCRACRGAGWLGTVADTEPVACPGCDGTGWQWRPTDAQIAEAREIVLRVYPGAAVGRGGPHAAAP